MAYGTAAGVSALVPAVGTLSTISLPTLAQVDAWLEQGAATIDRALAGAGFGTPVAALAGVYPELAALNELYAAAYVVMARGLSEYTATDAATIVGLGRDAQEAALDDAPRSAMVHRDHMVLL